MTALPVQPMLFALLATFAGHAAAAGLPPARQLELVRMVRQDCGSCHGMRLTGGLGPALTRDALVDKPVEGLAATIYYGRPGTPMPGWRRMLNETESLWIAGQLMQGFPEERPQADGYVVRPPRGDEQSGRATFAHDRRAQR